MFKKILLGFLGAATLVMGALLVTGRMMADKLSRPEVLKVVMAADEPCREAYAKVLDLQDRKDAGASKASAEGEPVCRKAYQTLHKINIFVPQQDLTNERLKRDTIKACAELSKIRADMLAQYAISRPDEQQLKKLSDGLGKMDASCQSQFKSLASRL